MDYDTQPFPASRKVIVDAGRLASRRHVVHGLLEVDVTTARSLLRSAKARGEDLSFTAFMVACFARAIAANPTVHAYRDWRGRLIVFHDVDGAPAARFARGFVEIIERPSLLAWRAAGQLMRRIGAWTASEPAHLKTAPMRQVLQAKGSKP